MPAPEPTWALHGQLQVALCASAHEWPGIRRKGSAQNRLLLHSVANEAAALKTTLDSSYTASSARAVPAMPFDSTSDLRAVGLGLGLGDMGLGRWPPRTVSGSFGSVQVLRVVLGALPGPA